MTRPVPIADTVLDRQRRVWVLVAPSLNPFDSMWECPATGAGATWAVLDLAYGVDVVFTAGRIEVSA